MDNGPSLGITGAEEREPLVVLVGVPVSEKNIVVRITILSIIKSASLNLNLHNLEG